jgi:hypothetical protein
MLVSSAAVGIGARLEARRFSRSADCHQYIRGLASPSAQTLGTLVVSPSVPTVVSS